MKDYIEWHKRKKEIENKKSRINFQIRDVLFCSIGENVGFEQDGRGEEFLRPIVVVKKFNKEVFLGVPLTHTEKKGKYYFSFSLNENKSVAILSQIRLFDAKRIKYKIGMINEKDFNILKEKIKQLLA
jgi:mRNA-degrading endonuclease toxin of MazEF toxin-antitoxin module